MDQKKSFRIPLKDLHPSGKPGWQRGIEKRSNTEFRAILVNSGAEESSTMQLAEKLLSRTGSFENRSNMYFTEIRGDNWRT